MKYCFKYFLREGFNSSILPRNVNIPTNPKKGGNKKKKGGLVQPHMRKHEQFIKPISSKPLIIFDVGLHLQLYVRYPVSDGSANHFLRR